MTEDIAAKIRAEIDKYGVAVVAYAAANATYPHEVDRTDGGLSDLTQVLFEYECRTTEHLAKLLGLADPDEVEWWQIFERIESLVSVSPLQDPDAPMAPGSQPCSGDPNDQGDGDD